MLQKVPARSCEARQGASGSDFLLRHQLRLQVHEAGSCTIAPCYLPSLTMLKLQLFDHSGTSRVSHVLLEGVPGQAHQGASASGYFVTSSAGAIRSWIRQLHHHRTVSGDPHNAQTTGSRPLRHVQSLGCIARGSAWSGLPGRFCKRFFRYIFS